MLVLKKKKAFLKNSNIPFSPLYYISPLFILQTTNTFKKTFKRVKIFCLTTQKIFFLVFLLH